jgi:pSer/pThr/pTyr-binding forkhead associated (FHA) protein
MPRRLLVINGADEGRWYSLADDGLRTVGSSHRHADIALNDLYVSRIHCEIKVEGDLVVLTALDNCPTMVNGARVTEQALTLGDVIRIGNSHLRLEVAEVSEPPPVEEVPVGVALEEEPQFEVVEEESAGEPAFPRRVPVDELARQSLGHYEIRAVLGQGHSGVVFQAFDQKSRQLVALKVLSPDFPQNEGEMQSYVRAVKRALALRHPHLISVLAAGRTSAYCWMALEYVEGEAVREVIERIGDGRKIKWKRALHIATHIAQGLDYLHQQRIVHGNITPENILIRRADRDAKLGDIMLRQALASSKLMEAIGPKQRLAELPYTPPELLTPGAEPDTLCDLYSLGAVTYALMAGRPPFKGDSPEAIRAQIRDSLPERPRTTQKHIPIQFQAIVLRLLAKRPEDRYPSAAELVADLEHIAEANEE